MALSELSAQLASLHQSSAAIGGSTLPSSRRHGDAVGRGVHHSSLLGHSSTGASTKFRPSVLTDDARGGTDVPLTALRSAAESGMTELYERTGNPAFDILGSAGGKWTVGSRSVDRERGTGTKKENAEVDRAVTSLLTALGTVLADGAATLSSSSSADAPLRILEYLLRRHSCHIHLPEPLLLSVLPHHETRLFARVLRLVDLASASSAASRYVFLRPYAASIGDARSAAARSGEEAEREARRRLGGGRGDDGADRDAEAAPRSLIAKWAARDDGLIGALAGLARDAAGAHSAEVRARSPDWAASGGVGGSVPVRPGVSRVISFVAAVLTEAMEVQTRDRSNHGSVKESTVRAILPFVLGSCGDGGANNGDGNGDDDVDGDGASFSATCPDYRSYGNVLASALASLCGPSLSPDVREVLAATVLKGAGGKGNDGAAAVADLAEAILTAASVLSSSSSSGSGTGSAALPPSVYRALCSRPLSLPSALGLLLAEEGGTGGGATGALIASVAKSALEEIVSPLPAREETKKRRRRRKNQDQSMETLSGLINDPSLRSIWSGTDDRAGPASSLAASVAYGVVTKYARREGGDGGKEENEEDDERCAVNCREILRALRSGGGCGGAVSECDLGIAGAVNAYSALRSPPTGRAGDDCGKEKMTAKRGGRRAARAGRVAALLGRQDDGDGGAPSLAVRGEGSGEVRNDVDDIDLTSLLPPRVALEHPDASVRLLAVTRLVDEARAKAAAAEASADRNADNDGMDVDPKYDFEDGDNVDDGLCRSLLRRGASDDDATVASAALGALVEGLGTDDDDVEGGRLSALPGASRLWEGEGAAEAADNAVRAVCTWSAFGSGRESMASKILSSSPHSVPSGDRADALVAALRLAGEAGSALLAAGTGGGSGGNDYENESARLCRLSWAVAAHVRAEGDADVGEEDGESHRRISAAAAAAVLRLATAPGGDGATSGRAAAAKRGAKWLRPPVDRLGEGARRALAECEGAALAGALRRACADLVTSATTDGVREPLSLGAMKVQFVWTVISAAAERLNLAAVESVSEELSSTSVNAALSLLRSYDCGVIKIDEAAAANLLVYLKTCLCASVQADPTKAPEIFARLASIKSTSNFENTALPAMQLAMKGLTKTVKGVKRSPLMESEIFWLMEAAACRNANVTAVCRLIEAAMNSLSSAKGGVSMNKGGKDLTPTPGLIHSLSLLTHPSRTVRETSLKLLPCLGSQGGTSDKLRALTSAVKSTSSMQSSLIMGGADALPAFLAEVAKNAGGPDSALAKTLMKNCELAAMPNIRNGKLTVLPGGCDSAAVVLSAMELAGEATFPLVKRWQYAGSQIFLSIIAKGSGDIMEKQHSLTHKSAPFIRLLNTIVLMLKGSLYASRAVGDLSSIANTVIMTEPAGVGRRRSYSFTGSSNGNSPTFINPFPEDMVGAICECLSVTVSEQNGRHKFLQAACSALIRLLLSDPAWGENVFRRLKAITRRKIAASLLVLRTSGDELAGLALLGLPLDASDFSFLVKNLAKENSNGNLLALTFLADNIRGRSSSLVCDEEILELSLILFRCLSALSEVPSTKEGADNVVASEDSGTEYGRSCLLRTLLSLHTVTKDNILQVIKTRKDTNYAKEFASFACLLVALVGGKHMVDDRSLMNVRALVSGRGKSTALALMTRLCAQAPKAVVGSLIPAVASVLASSVDVSELEVKAAGECLQTVVPVYCAHADAAGVSFVDLLGTFIETCGILGENVSESRSLELHSFFLDSLLSVPIKGGHGDAIASFLGTCLSGEAFNARMRSTGGDDADITSFCLRILRRAPGKTQIATIVQLLSYAGELIEGMGTMHTPNTSSCSAKGGHFYRISTTDLSMIALKGSWICDKKRRYSPSAICEEKDPEKQRSLIRLTMNFLDISRDGLSIPLVKKEIMKSEGVEANKCLQLWQDLMQLHSTALRFRSMEEVEAKQHKQKYVLSGMLKFWQDATSRVSDCLHMLQHILPIPHFLASITSLLCDRDIDGAIIVRAAQLLSERASKTNANSAEASLFLDIVPDLVNLLSVKSKTEHSPGVQQAALMAIERLAHYLCLTPKNEKLLKSRSPVFLSALVKVSDFMNDSAAKLIQSIGDDSVSHLEAIKSQLLSTAALCVSTLITVLKAKCLPLLSKLLKPLISSLTSINSSVGRYVGQGDDSCYRNAQLLQMSILRTLLSITENLSQFIIPHLDSIFMPSALPSRFLRQTKGDDSIEVIRMMERLENALIKKTPARHLIPAATKAVSKCLKEESGGCNETQALLKIIKCSIQGSSRMELSTVTSKLLNAFLSIFSFNGNGENHIQLQSSANEALLALVMKLSEAQLRLLYAKLREWKGVISESNEDMSAYAKRYSFWSLSATISLELRSIFLPCLSGLMDDIVSELDFAVTRLSSTPLSKKARQGKRRKISPNDQSYSNETMKPLQPLLLCLEASFKADAHGGGSWVRNNDGQRYRMIMEPLGKLLLANIPADMPVVVSLSEKVSLSVSAYEKIVQGSGTMEHGSVVGCLTALAAAAGNEQLWKPLNHAILEACGHEERAEVRKAGVKCLLSVIQTLGEEYMVLLPECLPILSELLEDEDEETAGMAKECITLGEELLGESLDDAII